MSELESLAMAVVINIEMVSSTKPNVYPLEKAFEIGRKDSQFIIVNMQRVTHMFSKDVALLIRKADEIGSANEGGEIAFCSIPSGFKWILEAVNIYDMLIKFDTMDECLRSLNWKIKKTIKAQIELDDAP